MWLILALAAYIFFAAATITDKYLLARPFPDARVYIFYTGILGIFVLLLAPFGLEAPSYLVVFVGILAGIVNSAALFLFFLVLKVGEVSRIGISLGGLVPFFTLLFIYAWTGELPSALQFMAFASLVAGSFVVIFERFINLVHNLKRFAMILASSFLFGLYFAVAKFLFLEQSFISAIVWIKIGATLFALFFLLFPSVRKTIFEHRKTLSKNAGLILISKNAAGGLGAFFQHVAISLARVSEVSLVNALQGVQFALVFFAALFLTKKFPGIIREEVRGEALAVKFLGTGLIVSGVVILAIS
ncbi:MAG: hypothetical protein WAP23_00810 [Candidatus Spechtbacterales bacterium]